MAGEVEDGCEPDTAALYDKLSACSVDYPMVTVAEATVNLLVSVVATARRNGMSHKDALGMSESLVADFREMIENQLAEMKITAPTSRAVM